MLCLSSADPLGWCRTELFSYETCIFYTVLTTIPTLDRVSLKAKVVDAPEILTVIDTIPNLSTFLNALYECRYADFFKVGSAAMAHSLSSLLCCDFMCKACAFPAKKGKVRLQASCSLSCHDSYPFSIGDRGFSRKISWKTHLSMGSMLGNLIELGDVPLANL